MPTQTHPLSPTGPVALDGPHRGGAVVVDATATDGYAVELSTRNDGDLDDVRVAADDHRVEVEIPKRWIGRQPKVHVVVRIPAGSTVDLTTASASIETKGELAEGEVRSASGSVHLDRITGSARVEVVSGGAAVEHVGGDLSIKSVSGSTRVGTVGGDCTITSVSGSTEIGHAAHDVKIKAASGAIRARSVQAGSVDLGATSGSIQSGSSAAPSSGSTLGAASGSVRSDLDDEPAPPTARPAPALQLRAHTTSGSVRIERSTLVNAEPCQDPRP